MTPSKNNLAGLGRIVSKDDRDRGYMLTRPSEARSIEYHYWPTQQPLDQLDTPQCVGFSGYRWLTSFPVKNVPQFSPEFLYRASQDEDEWPGNNYDGTSVRGLFKALKRLGYVNEYRWAFDAATIVDHLLTKGPVVVGTEWTYDMFMLDDEGFIDDMGSQVVGGHAYLLVGASRTKKSKHGIGAVRILNSWGPSWGENGRAWLSINGLELLLRKDGEAATATELKVS